MEKTVRNVLAASAVSFYLGVKLTQFVCAAAIHNHEDESDFVHRMGAECSCQYDEIYDRLADKGKAILLKVPKRYYNLKLNFKTPWR